MIRTQVAPETIVPALRKVLRAADRALPLVAVRTQQAQIDEDLADERLLVQLDTCTSRGARASDGRASTRVTTRGEHLRRRA
jgi:hypothetical protein